MEIKLDEKEKRKKVEEKKKFNENLDKSKCAEKLELLLGDVDSERGDGAQRTVIGILINTKRMTAKTSIIR